MFTEALPGNELTKFVTTIIIIIIIIIVGKTVAWVETIRGVQY
jgi:hypothetical protein